MNSSRVASCLSLGLALTVSLLLLTGCDWSYQPRDAQSIIDEFQSNKALFERTARHAKTAARIIEPHHMSEQSPASPDSVLFQRFFDSVRTCDKIRRKKIGGSRVVLFYMDSIPRSMRRATLLGVAFSPEPIEDHYIGFYDAIESQTPGFRFESIEPSWYLWAYNE